MPSGDQHGDQTASTDGTDAIDIVIDAAALLHVNGQSTGMTLTAVDRLNRGLGTTSTLIPAWASLLLVGRRTPRPVSRPSRRPASACDESRRRWRSSTGLRTVHSTVAQYGGDWLPHNGNRCRTP